MTHLNEDAAQAEAVQGLRDEIRGGMAQVDMLAARVARLLAASQAENLGLQLENSALRAENAFLQGRLAGKSLKLTELRQAVKALRQQEAAFRQELIREMTYTAELTERIEVEGEEQDE